MITPDFLNSIADDAGKIAATIHERIIAAIIDRLAARFERTGQITFTASDRWQIETLQQSGYLLDDIKRIIAKYTGQELKTIHSALQRAGVTSLEYDNDTYRRAGLPVSGMSPEMTRIVSRMYQSTAGLWYNYTRTTEMGATTLFKSLCDDAYINVMSGAMGWTQAYANAIHRLAYANAAEVVYPTGHRDTIETATMRAVRTAAAQTAGQITAERAAENGITCFMTSSHIGARPTHFEWQGQVFWVDWQRLATLIPLATIPETEASAEEKAKYREFCDATQIGTVTGLHGVNCRHSYMPFIDGVSYNPAEQFDKKENDEYYKLTQQQRRLERNIRRQKLELYGLEKTGLPNDEIKAAHASLLGKIRQNVKNYYTFCEEHGLKPDTARLQTRFD